MVARRSKYREIDKDWDPALKLIMEKINSDASLTPAGVSKQTKLNENFLHYWMKGTKPSHDSVVEILKVLDISTVYLTDDEMTLFGMLYERMDEVSEESLVGLREFLTKRTFKQ